MPHATCHYSGSITYERKGSNDETGSQRVVTGNSLSCTNMTATSVVSVSNDLELTLKSFTSFCIAILGTLLSTYKLLGRTLLNCIQSTKVLDQPYWTQELENYGAYDRVT